MAPSPRNSAHDPVTSTTLAPTSSETGHQLTNCPLRSPTRPIRQAAITAIHDGTERITKQSLEAIRLDHLAETHHRPTRNR